MALRVSNEETLNRTKLKRINEEVKVRRWKWIVHVFRMEDNCDCRTATTWWVPGGRRTVGHLRTTWRHTAEKERKQLGLRSWNDAKPVAKNRANRREGTTVLG